MSEELGTHGAELFFLEFMTLIGNYTYLVLFLNSPMCKRYSLAGR